MGTLFKSAWWLAQVPDGWSVDQSSECTTFAGKGGAVQVSSFRKAGGQVTAEDLREFGEDRPGFDSAKACRTESLEGFTWDTPEDVEVSGREWLLASGSLMVFVTYYWSEYDRQDDTMARTVVSSLRPNEAGAV